MIIQRQKPLIQLISNDHVSAMELEERLLSLGYVVLAKNKSFEQGAAVFESHQPELIIAEWDDAFIDDIYFQQLLQELSVPILFVSLALTPALHQLCQTSRMVHLIQRPFADIDLHSAIQQVLGTASIYKQYTKYEEELKQNARLLQLFFNQVLSAIFFAITPTPLRWRSQLQTPPLAVLRHLQETLTITKHNRSLAEQYRLKPEEGLIKQPLRCLFPSNEIYEHFLATLLEKKQCRFAFSKELADGSVATYEGNYSLILDEQGAVIGVLGIQQDITHRKRHERLLKISKQRFERLAAYSPDIIIVAHTQDFQKIRFSYVNKPNILGFKEKAIDSPDKLMELVHPQDFPTVRAYFQDISQKNEYPPIQVRLKNQAGEWEWFQCQYVVLSPEDEQEGKGYYEILFYLHNLTEKIRYENQLKEEKANLLALIESSHNPIFSVDRKLHVKTYNTAFLNLIHHFKPALHEAAGQPLSGVFPKEELNFWLEHIQKTFLGEKQEVPHRLHFKEKGTIHYEVAFYPIIEESQITGVTVIARDVTEQEKMRLALEKSNYELDTFIYRSSHDLRAPLSSILGLLQLLRMPVSDQEKAHYIQLIEKSVAKLDRVIYSLIDFSRNMHLPLDFDYVDVEQIVYDCYEQLQSLPHADRLRIHFINGCPKELVSDENRLRIVLYHLLSNSIRYQDLHKEETHIHITIECHQDTWTLSFKDNGKGIADNIKQNLFHMFQRSNEENRGAGLGLYIIKQVVQKLQGEVEIKSQLGEGTEVIITLPLLKEKAVVL